MVERIHQVRHTIYTLTLVVVIRHYICVAFNRKRIFKCGPAWSIRIFVEIWCRQSAQLRLRSRRGLRQAVCVYVCNFSGNAWLVFGLGKNVESENVRAHKKCITGSIVTSDPSPFDLWFTEKKRNARAMGKWCLYSWWIFWEIILVFKCIPFFFSSQLKCLRLWLICCCNQ